MEVVNETLVLANCYFMVLYSEFVPDVYVRYKLGWFNIALIATMIVINVFIIGRANVKAAYRKYKLAKNKKNYRKSLTEYAAKYAMTEALKKALKKKDDKIVYEESSESSSSISSRKESPKVSSSQTSED